MRVGMAPSKDWVVPWLNWMASVAGCGAAAGDDVGVSAGRKRLLLRTEGPSVSAGLEGKNGGGVGAGRGGSWGVG